VAIQTLDISRRRQTFAETPLELRDQALRYLSVSPDQALRDLSIALSNVGRVHRGLSNLEAARSAYRESLEFCRELREAVGETPKRCAICRFR
jgi:hypothetical protein